MPLLRALLSLAALLPCCLAAQVAVTGRTVDARTFEPLPFVNITVDGTRTGTVSDIDGRFTIAAAALPVTLRFTYVGYDATTLSVTDAAPVTVRLSERSELLREAVILPGENPAHRIIKAVHRNRKENDGMRHRAHRYRSYSKTIFTALLDSAKLDDTAWIASLDTSAREAYDFFNSQHLLLIESATEKSFDPPAREQERVLAMRVSGLKDPSLLALAASTTTFSIYEPTIALMDRTYAGPIGAGSTDMYFFLLEDTLYRGTDSVFVISFRPRKGRKFDGLKGLLYVNTDGYAVQNAIAEPVEQEGGIGLKVQQLHERVGGAWFPVQMNTTFLLSNVSVNSWTMTGIGRTYLRDIEVDVDIARGETRGPAFTAEKMMTRNDETYWTALRNDTLDAKDLKTYHVIDSLGEAENLDRKLLWITALSTGFIPWGPFDIELGRILAYNRYEGLRLGAGLRTNDNVTRYASIGGYAAYGFNDREWKWGGDLRVKPDPARSFELRGYYAHDVAESGGVSFKGPRPLFNADQVRLLYMDRMDRIERMGGEVSFRLGGSLKLWVGTAAEQRTNDLGYAYAHAIGEGITLFNDVFRTGEVNVDLRYAFRERIAQLPDRQINMGTKWPVVQVSFTQAVDGLWGGDQEFWRVSAMTEKTFRTRRMGTPTVRVMAGMASPDAAYSWLFNLRGSKAEKFGVNTPFAFETMLPNEFLADRFAVVHFRHSFGRLLVKTKKWQPIPVIVTSAGWGSLEQPADHRGLSFRAMEHGFYESGAELTFQSGLSTFGVGGYWRYGPYTLPEASDNFTAKLALGFAF